MVVHLSAQEVQRRIDYDPATGLLRWKADPPKGKAVGDLLPSRDNGNGYLYSTVNRRAYAVHRLAWVIVHGYWPDEVDHRNTVKSDNRLINLREASRSQNEMNAPKRSDNTSGYKGVGWHKCKSQWRAYIQKDGKQISLGYHPSAEIAHRAYSTAAKRLFGDFARCE